MKKRMLSIIVSLCLCTSLAFGGFITELHTGNVPTKVYGAEISTAASKLEAPTITVKASGYTAIKISWGKSGSAIKYNVYRAASKSGTYKKLVSTQNTSYIDKKAQQNKTYYYKVSAIAKKASNNSIKSTAKAGKINTVVSLLSIPSYSGKPYTEVNKNIPKFRKADLTTKSYEKYSALDSKGRCRTAISSIGRELMPTGNRGSIGMVKPTGWHTVKYDCVSGKYLYNRCHLIGFQLTGENANSRNLITGTRYLNVEGMLPFENMVADYIKETGNHVLYRVTPIFKGSNLLASGVQIEAKSVEDNGEGICFNVYVYNVQPKIKINYATGDSKFNGTSSDLSTITGSSGKYVLNTNTKKFHKPTCYSIKQMSESNKKSYNGSRNLLIQQGYSPCKNCNP